MSVGVGALVAAGVGVGVDPVAQAVGRGLDASEMADFMAAVFAPARAALPGGLEWTIGFQDVETSPAWFGRAGLGHLVDKFGPDLKGGDLYFCIATLRAEAKGRGNAAAGAQCVLIVDDIGTKIDRGLWDRLFGLGFPLPHAEVETSPGNFTFVWTLAGDPTAPERWPDLALVRAWLVHRGLTDEVMDVARVVRLPGGWNSKLKYRDASGDLGSAPEVKLAEWRNPAVWGLADLDVMGVLLTEADAAAGDDWRTFLPPVGSLGAQAVLTGGQLGGPGGSGGGVRVRSADMGSPEALIRLAVEVGLQPRQIRAGVVEALCPNMAAHTTRAETGFAFLGDGLAHCNHAACQGHTSVDFRAMMLDRLDEVIGGNVLVGAGLGTGPGDARSASEWWAREQLADAGGFGDAAEAVAVANQMAAAASARVVETAAAVAAGMDGLVGRFARVTYLGSFFDTVDRVLVPDTVFDAHPAVLPVVEVGLGGVKRARNQVLNRADLVHLGGVVRMVGQQEAMVMAPDETGHVRAQANVWRGGPWFRRYLVRDPVEWLELLTHVVPDEGYRVWFIKWLARLFQCPGQRAMTIPLVQGGQGVGKDAMLIPIRHLLGLHNVQALEMKDLERDFNDYVLKDLLIVSEVKMDAEGRGNNRIKTLVTNQEEWARVNEKFVPPYMARVHFSMVGFTNYLNALQGLDPDDRRWQPYLSEARKRDAGFYTRVIGGMMTPEALMGLHNFLMHEVDLDGFTAFTPAPGSEDAKGTMQIAGLPGAALWVWQQVQTGGLFQGRNLLTLEEIEAAALSDRNRRVSGAVDMRLLGRGLQAAKWQALGQKGSRAGDRLSLWASPAFAGGPAVGLFDGPGLVGLYKNEKQNALLDAQARLGI